MKITLEHKTISLADQVFDRLEKEILDGVYTRGEVLTELRLVSDLGVSRTPIREALRRLEQEHIVEMTGKGILILGVTKDDFFDIMEIRKHIEGIAAARAAKNITPEQLDELREAIELQEYYVSKRDAEQIRSFDGSFHRLMYRFSGSTVLEDTLTPLHKKAQKYRRTSVENSSRAEQSAKEHRAIFEAIAAHDEKKAEEAMLLHIENAKQHIAGGKN